MSFVFSSRGVGSLAKASLFACLVLAGVSASSIPVAFAQSATVQLPTVTVEGQRTEEQQPDGTKPNTTATAEDPKGPGNGIAAAQTVSGTKTDTPRIEIPQSISIVTREQMNLLKPRTLLEATRFTPGIRENSGGNDTRTDLFRVRGFSAEATGLYLNGLQLPSPGFAIFRLEPFGLDRVEVLRGPSSVLYGGTNPGGMINAVSKRPTFTPFGNIETGINNFGNGYIAVDVGTPGASTDGKPSPWAYRFTALGKAGDTQTDHIRDGRTFLAPSVTYQPSLDTKLTVLAQYQYDRSNNINFLPYLGTVKDAPFGRISTDLFTGEPSTDKITREQAMIGYEFEHRFNDVFTVRQNMRYSHIHTEYFNAAGLGYFGVPTATSAVLRRGLLNAQPTANVFNVDNQLEANFGTGVLSHKVLFGVDYKRLSFDDRSVQTLATPFNVLNPNYGTSTPSVPFTTSTDNVQNQTGVYLQDQIKFDRFALVLSGRQDFVQSKTDFNLSPSQNTSSNDSAFSGRVGLVYTSDIGLAPYVSYSRSFQPVIGVNPATNAPYLPETGEQYEVGVKYQPKGSKSFVGVAAFDLTRQNFLTNNPLNFNIQDQSGEARSKGLEFEAALQLTDELKVLGAYTAFDLKNTANNLDPTVIDKVPTGTPQQFGSVFADYTFQTGPLAGFGLGYGIRYNGPSYADTLNTLEVPSYTLHDAVIHYEKGHWRAAVNFTNLFDKTYVGFCNSATQCFYGERRKILGSLAYRW